MPAIFCGIVVAAAGVVPLLALDRAPADVTEQANLIYVYQRLPHHLVWHKMPPVRILRFAIMVVIWIVARQRVTLSPANLFLQRFAEASLWIAAGGLALDAIGVVAPALCREVLEVLLVPSGRYCRSRGPRHTGGRMGTSALSPTFALVFASFCRHDGGHRGCRRR